VSYCDSRLPGLPGMQQHYEALAATVRARPAGAQAAGFEEFVDLFRAQVATVSSNRTWAQTQVIQIYFRSASSSLPALFLSPPFTLPRSLFLLPVPPSHVLHTLPASLFPNPFPRQLSPKEISLLLQKSALTIPELGTVLATFRLLDYEGRGALKLDDLRKAKGIEKEVVESVLEVSGGRFGF
jgi:hypothetical protein